ncbi:MAG TPA: carotenoid oxygenase family protein [Solirubrobacteraceae bacterium]|nr:carotenoid oxygenase family protein [Solirubrobacteraceae bacterium]
MATTTQETTQLGPQAGYRSLKQEVSVDAIEVEGNLPSWLSGSLLRNGPGLYEDGERSVNHWFDGQAMLHRFTLAEGGVSYANRFLQTKSYHAMRDGELALSEFATDPCRSIFKRLMTVFDPQVTDNSAVSLAKLGDRHYAMTEAPISVQFDPHTLETLGFSDRYPGTFATAHPHRDPDNGALINVATRMGPRNSYRFFVHAPGQRPRVLATKGVSRPGYVHSFAMSQRYIALTEFPFTVNSIEIPLSGRPFIENFRWHPERATRILVFDRHTGQKIGIYETEAGFAFHHVGAWDEDGRLVMEYCDHGSPEIIDAFYLERLRRARTADFRPQPRLRRVVVDLGGRTTSTEYRSQEVIELPRINEQWYLRPYRFVYGLGTTAENNYDTADRLVKVDNESGDAAVWHEPAAYVGEPVFVPSPESNAEDDGVVLSVVLDAGRERSYLLALDARSMTELARAYAPHVIPFGFHGQFYPEA